LSGEELKKFLAKKKARKLAEKVMCGDERVLVSDKTFAAFDIFEVPRPKKLGQAADEIFRVAACPL
jgi:hypothetical protein